MSYRNIDFSRPLYIELARIDKCCGSELRPATKKEFNDAKDYYNRHNKCKHHLVYDETGQNYDSRYCGICGKFIRLI